MTMRGYYWFLLISCGAYQARKDSIVANRFPFSSHLLFGLPQRFATSQSATLSRTSWVAIAWEVLTNQHRPSDLLLGYFSNK